MNTSGKCATLMRYQTLPDKALWRWTPAEAFPARAAFPESTGCRQEHFHEPYFAYWTKRMCDTLRYHRKLWEFVFICCWVTNEDLLVAGKKGVGFGVGGEPLPSLFAWPKAA